jgi:hypothetical protein
MGVMFYESLTGIHPFRKGLSADTAAAILGEDPVPITSLRKEISALLEYVVKKMLVKEQDRRYQSIHEVHTDLKEVALQVDRGSSPERSAGTGGRQSRIVARLG